MAAAIFTMVFLMEHMEELKNNQHLQGGASEIVKKLINKYQPAGHILGVKAEKEQFKLKMKKMQILMTIPAN